MQFEWDELKAATNLTKHGVSFEDATTVFGVLCRTRCPTLIIRWTSSVSFIGVSESAKILVVAHTDDGQAVRIISAREATHGERQFYEEG